MRYAHGHTNKFGLFSDAFQIPDNYTIGEYLTFVDVEKDGSTAGSTLSFFVFSSPTNSGGGLHMLHIGNGNGNGHGHGNSNQKNRG